MIDILRPASRWFLAAGSLLFSYSAGTAQPLLSELRATADNPHSLAVPDKCGTPDYHTLALKRQLLGDGWGYGYDQLLGDLERWKQSPYVSVQSIGKTVEDRDIWELTITSDQPSAEPRRRVTIHARTHPHETQSWWVCEQLLHILLSEDPWAAYLRENCTFHVIPMYNPDGVEAMYTRYNANGVDLEREWDKPDAQPEAVALKQRFSALMNSEAPIEVALNLHSSSDPERYFWFHDHTGTSNEFADLQRHFIDGSRTWFQRIMPWDYRVSWIDNTPTHFPESWFWHNYGTDVMALTYEDVFSHNLSTPDAFFDSTAWALLRGVAGYLGLKTSSVQPESLAEEINLAIRGTAPINITHSVNRRMHGQLAVYDALGRRVTLLAEKDFLPGSEESYRWDPEQFPSGMYYLRFATGAGSIVKPIQSIR